MNLLVIEDDKEVMNFLRASLKGEGFVIDTATDGVAGLEKAITNDYDLIILDIGLPLKSGDEVCSAIRAVSKQVPILILSAKNETIDKVNILNAGADDYLVKPFSFTELSARIRALLRRPPQLQGNELTIGNIKLDISQHRVMQGSRQLSFTPKEFFLLEYLLRSRGRVISRQAILEHVWDINADPFTNTIETHVASIRRKLGGKAKTKFFRTVSGIGYAID